jgi:hypothetical protein
MAFACVQVHPGLTSWDILSRPCGTRLGEFVYPGLTSWATLSRPCGTDRDLVIADLISASAVQNQPIGKKLIWTSLILSRPYGTGFVSGVFTQTPKPVPFKN